MRVEGREGEDVHVAHGSGGSKVGDGITLKTEIPGVGEGGRPDLDFVALIDMHQTNVVDRGGVREGYIPRGEVAVLKRGKRVGLVCEW